MPLVSSPERKIAPAHQSEFRVRSNGPLEFLKTDFGKASIILGVCYVLMLATLWSYGLIDPSDGWYSEPAREMLERGEYLTPLLNYQPFYEKPIGIYWAIIACYKIFGMHEFSARLPSALAAIVCSAYSFKVLWDLNMRRAGLLSALIIIGTPLLVVLGHLCLTDMVFTACITVGLLSLFAHLSGLRKLYWYTGYAALGTAVLVKGPTALVLGGLILGAYSFVRSGTGGITEGTISNFWQSIRKLSPLLGLLLVVAISLPWYAYETISSNGAFFQEFFIKQHLQRAAGEVNHQRPFYFFFLVIAAGFAPWYIFMYGFRDLRRQVLKRHSQRADLIKFCAIWAALWVGIFSLSSSKLSTYILPALPPMAILSAIGMEYMIRMRQAKALKVIAGLISIVGIGCLVGVALSRGLWEDPTDLFEIVIPLFMFAVVPSVVVLLTKDVKRQLLVLTGCYALATGIGVATTIHSYDELRSRPLRKLIATAAESGGSLATFMRDSPTVVFYWRKHVPYMNTPQDYQAFKAKYPGPHFVLTTADVAPVAEFECPDLKRVEASKKWWLYRAE